MHCSGGQAHLYISNVDYICKLTRFFTEFIHFYRGHAACTEFEFALYS